MRLRQIALIAGELEPVVEDLCDVLGLEVAFHDPGVEVFGLRNAVMPVGDTFLEVVSPLHDDTAGARYRKRLGGDAGYMVILQCPDLDQARARIDRLGVRVVFEAKLEDIRAMHLHPRDTGGTLLSLDQPEPLEEWRWAGPRWKQHRRTDRVSAIRSATIQSPDPAALAERWSQLLDRPVEGLGEDASRIALEGSELRFAPSRDRRGECLAGFGVACSDPEQLLQSAVRRGLETRGTAVRIGGAWISLEPRAA